MTTKLDDPVIYHRFDKTGMLDHVHALPQQCREAWQTAIQFPIPPNYASVNKIVILGMGGSAIGGDLLSSLVATESHVPIFIYRDYDLPSFVDAKTLVIASSYSGNTEETLSSFSQALATDAKKLAITTGGRLGELAASKGVPVFTTSYQSQPRAALGYSFFPLLAFLQRLNILSDKAIDMAEMGSVLESLVPRLAIESSLASNPAKQLAAKLVGRLAVVYGAGFLEEVARRWKTQINENSKGWAFFETLPELNHNAVAGYQFPAGMQDQVMVILLYSLSLNPRTRLRYLATTDILSGIGIPHETVQSVGTRPLAQMMSSILIGDFVSCYLAILNQTDPTPVQVIEHLKERLGNTRTDGDI